MTLTVNMKEIQGIKQINKQINIKLEYKKGDANIKKGKRTMNNKF